MPLLHRIQFQPTRVPPRTRCWPCSRAWKLVALLRSMRREPAAQLFNKMRIKSMILTRECTVSSKGKNLSWFRGPCICNPHFKEQKAICFWKLRMERRGAPPSYSGPTKILSTKSTHFATCLNCPPKTNPYSAPVSTWAAPIATKAYFGPCTTTNRCRCHFSILKSRKFSRTVLSISGKQSFIHKTLWLSPSTQLINTFQRVSNSSSEDAICQILFDENKNENDCDSKENILWCKQSNYHDCLLVYLIRNNSNKLVKEFRFDWHPWNY